MITVNAAYIRAWRLEKAGVHNQAVKQFQNAMYNIKHSGLSRSEKAAARQAAAAKFEDSGRSTLSQIKSDFEDYLESVPEDLRLQVVADEFSTAEKSRYLDGTENQKNSVLAAHYLSSDNIAAMRDKWNERTGSKEEATDDFYEDLNKMINTAYEHPDYDEAKLNDIITKGYDKQK